MLTIAGDASRDVASNASVSALIAVVVLLALAAIGARWLTRTRDTQRGSLAWFAAFGSIAGCLSLTLFREGFRFGFRPAGVLAWTTTGWDRLADGNLLGSSQFLLNVALFVPAGVAWTWVTARPLRTLGGLVGLTMLIESVQGMTGTGGADVTDVVANSLGAAIGVGAAAIATAVLVRAGLTTGRASDPRRRAIVAACLVVVVAFTAAGLLIGADQRQSRIHSELERMFEDTTYDEINSVLTADPDNPEPLAGRARFVDLNQILDAISVRSDGGRTTDNKIELRWPALFFGFRRCVYVTWTPSGVDFSDASGRACTEFLG